MKNQYSGKWVVFSLAISAFAIGTAEFMMAGILPDISRAMLISIPQAGWLMTAYALSVFISAPLLTVLTINFARKNVLLGLLLFFIVGNIISALAPTYFLLMVGRVIAALCHGAFFGIAAVVAADSVDTHKRSQAIALMFTGLTLANVLGVPLGTFIGNTFGWRSTFWMVSLLGIIGIVGILLLIPKQTLSVANNLSAEFSIFKRPQVWLALLVTALGFGGLFATFAYIAPLMILVTGFSASDIVWLLLLFGTGLVIGNFVGGKAADRSIIASIQFFYFLLALLLFGLVFIAHIKILATITLFFLGVVGFAIVSPIQTQVVVLAKEAPTLASASNISAFNGGIALGTFLGSMTIKFGLGYTSVAWTGGILVLLGLATQYLLVHLAPT